MGIDRRDGRLRARPVLRTAPMRSACLCGRRYSSLAPLVSVVRFGQICDVFINNGGALIQRRVGHVNAVGIAGLGSAQGVWIFAVFIKVCV